MHSGTGGNTNYPHRTSLWIELRDNRGNLADIAGINRRLNASQTSAGSDATIEPDRLGYFRGGFFDSDNTTTGNRLAMISNGFPLAQTGTGGINTLNSIRNVCGIDSSATTYAGSMHATYSAYVTRMVSMERASSLNDGTVPGSWEHATKTGATGGTGIYIKSDFKARTIATPGERNSRWTALP
ncbi:MAG: hypothetical protein KDK41_12500 [Leptospiraceae bacterium]|nr:hypothetical protein [Leptospiraceae bacterium]